MTPDMVSGIVQSLPKLSDSKSESSQHEEKGTGSPNAGAALTKDGKQGPVDTVTISYQSRQTIMDVKKKEAVIEEAKKEETKIINSSEISGRARAQVQFVYDLKGELSIRYMDTANKLIYQAPSELMLRLKEAASKSDSSVDTKA